MPLSVSSRPASPNPDLLAIPRASWVARWRPGLRQALLPAVLGWLATCVLTALWVLAETSGSGFQDGAATGLYPTVSAACLLAALWWHRRREARHVGPLFRRLPVDPARSFKQRLGFNLAFAAVLLTSQALILLALGVFATVAAPVGPWLELLTLEAASVVLIAVFLAPPRESLPTPADPETPPGHFEAERIGTGLVLGMLFAHGTLAWSAWAQERPHLGWLVVGVVVGTTLALTLALSWHAHRLRLRGLSAAPTGWSEAPIFIPPWYFWILLLFVFPGVGDGWKPNGLVLALVVWAGFYARHRWKRRHEGNPWPRLLPFDSVLAAASVGWAWIALGVVETLWAERSLVGPLASGSRGTSGSLFSGSLQTPTLGASEADLEILLRALVWGILGFNVLYVVLATVALHGSRAGFEQWRRQDSVLVRLPLDPRQVARKRLTSYLKLVGLVIAVPLVLETLLLLVLQLFGIVPVSLLTVLQLRTMFLLVAGVVFAAVARLVQVQRNSLKALPQRLLQLASLAVLFVASVALYQSADLAGLWLATGLLCTLSIVSLARTLAPRLQSHVPAPPFFDLGVVVYRILRLLLPARVRRSLA